MISKVNPNPSGNTLLTISLPLNLYQFLSIVWEDDVFLKSFLVDKIREKRVNIGNWMKLSNQGDNDIECQYERTITSLHPIPSTYLLFNLDNKNTQRIWQKKAHYNQNHKPVLYITESSMTKGVPYTIFNVTLNWIVTLIHNKKIKCEISVTFQYDKANYLQSVLETSYKNELMKYFKLLKSEVSNKVNILRSKDSSQYFEIRPKILVDFQIGKAYVNPLISNIDASIKSQNRIKNEIAASKVTSSTVKNNEISQNSENDIAVNDESNTTLKKTHYFTNEDYNIFLQINQDDIDDFKYLIQFSTLKQRYSIEYVYRNILYNDIIYNHKYFKILSLILFMSSLKSIEYYVWSTDSYRMISYLKTVNFLIFYHLVALIVLDVLYVYLQRKLSRYLSFRLANDESVDVEVDKL